MVQGVLFKNSGLERRYSSYLEIPAWKLNVLYKSKLLIYQTVAENISLALLSSPIKIRGTTIKGFLSYDRTCKHVTIDLVT